MSWHIRPFQNADTNAILEMSKLIWRGHDHLPQVLGEVATDANSYPFVLESRSRVVAFANLRIIEEGFTGWMELMRVHPRFRKRGIAWALTKQLLTTATEFKVKRLRLTSMTTNPAVSRITTMLGMHEVFKLTVFWRWYLHRLRWKDTSVPMTPCTPEEAFHFLQATPHLIPSGLVVKYWMVYEATKSTLQTIGEEAQFWKSASSETNQALSFGFLRRLPDHNEWISTIYAMDEPAFLSSLSHQFQTAKKQNAVGAMCFHSSQFQAAGVLPGLKRHIHKGQLALYELNRPFPTFK
jgi:RimJ/RimL family protein N-acetyltransferase